VKNKKKRWKTRKNGGEEGEENEEGEPVCEVGGGGRTGEE